MGFVILIAIILIALLLYKSSDKKTESQRSSARYMSNEEKLRQIEQMKKQAAANAAFAREQIRQSAPARIRNMLIGYNLIGTVDEELSDIMVDEIVYRNESNYERQNGITASEKFINALKSRLGYRMNPEQVKNLIDGVIQIEKDMNVISDDFDDMRLNVSIGNNESICMTEAMYHRYELMSKTLPEYNG